MVDEREKHICFQNHRERCSPQATKDEVNNQSPLGSSPGAILYYGLTFPLGTPDLVVFGQIKV